MSNIKRFLWEQENEPSLTDLQEYELYCLYEELSQKFRTKTKEELLDFFRPLMEGDENE